MKELNHESFKESVLEYSGVNVVDFYADWCNPCKMWGRLLENISSDFPSIKFVKVNADDNFDLSNKYSIRNLPTTLIFQNGKLIDRINGTISKQSLIDKLNGITKGSN